MVNGISERGLSVNHKVRTVNFPSGEIEKFVQKLDDKIKEMPGDPIIFLGTNEITNNVNLLAN